MIGALDLPTYIETLHARVRREVEETSVEEFAERVMRSPKTIRTFLRDPMDIHISTLAVLGREMGMEIGEIHCLPLTGDGRCLTCGRTKDEHDDSIPMFPQERLLAEDERRDGDEGTEVPD